MKGTRLVILAALVAAALFALPASPALGATFTVTKTADTNDGTCDGDCSLREAIVAANAAGGADTITLPGGTYVLTIAGAGENAAATGDLDITGNLTINGAGAATTIVNANSLDRAFDVTGSSTVNISALTVQNGTATAGGGILNFFGALTLADVIVSGNSATNTGGGIYNEIGTATLNSSTVSGNSAAAAGGVYNGNTLILNSSTVSGNSAATNGGGIYNSATATLTNSTVSGNSANIGGGIYNNSGTVILTSSTVSNNSASLSGGGGGGIYNNGVTATLSLNSSTVSGNAATDGGGILNGGAAALTLNSSTVRNNSATNGGGIWSNGPLTLTSSTVSGNSASFGGGIFNSFSTATVNSSTVSGNSASISGGGIYDDVSTTTLKNTIVANSPSGGNCDSFSMISNGYNLSSDGTCTSFTNVGDMQNTNPSLGPLAFNGGPTPTHALLDGGSPAVDAGSPTCPPTDQRGVSRPQGFRCDIGAYEAPDSDGDGVADPLDTDDDNDGVPDSDEWPGCRTLAEDYDGFQDSDGCPDPDNDLDGVCDAGQTALSCSGSDTGKMCFDPALTLSCSTQDCRNVAEDLDAFHDSDGCPEPDNDNDGHPDVADMCPGTDAHAGADAMLGTPQDLNHNGVRDNPPEAVFATDDTVLVFEDYDGVIDADGCHDSPGDDFDGDTFSDDTEALFLGTNPMNGCSLTDAPNDEIPDPWPVDFDDNQVVNIVDVIRVLPPFFGSSTGDPDYSKRSDLVPDGVINILDVIKVLPPVFGSTCP